MLLMAVDFGRLFYSYIGINNAAREGATYAAQYGASQTSTPDCANASACADPDNIVFHARQEMGGDTTLTVTSICPSTCKSSSTTATNLVRVTSSQQFTFITPLISGLMGGPLNISASVSAIIL
jgi:Flp pilus assembly protein TadG